MRTQAYNILQKRLDNKAKNKGLLLSAVFELTYRCNFKCKHCYVPPDYSRKKGELKTKEVFSILDQLKSLGCFHLRFTGGEPFMRKDIMDILRYAKRCGFELIIYTNGSLIDEKIADELAALRTRVDITIPGISKSVFERISGVTDSRDRVFRSIEFLHKRGLYLRTKTCVLKTNEEEVEDIKNFAASLNIPHGFDAAVLPRLDGSRKPYRYKAREIERIIQMEKTDLGRDTAYGWSPDDSNFFNCEGGETKAAITPMGELKICVNIDKPKYDIQKNSLSDCWEKLREFVRGVKPDKNYHCGECELKLYCAWCPAISWLESRSFSTCNPESRRFAQIRKKNKKQIHKNRLIKV